MTTSKNNQINNQNNLCNYFDYIYQKSINAGIRHVLMCLLLGNKLFTFTFFKLEVESIFVELPISSFVKAV